MKKYILFFTVLTISFFLMAFNYIQNHQSKDQDKMQETLNIHRTVSFAAPFSFHYDVNSRFINTITREQLHKSSSIREIYPEGAMDHVGAMNKNIVALILGEEEELSEIGEGEQLTEAQMALLRSTDYSSLFYIRAEITGKFPMEGNRHDYISYYMTVVPEQQAAYPKGMDALINYYSENTKEDVAGYTEKELKPGQITFTVSKEGSVKDVLLQSSCGQEKIDRKLMELTNSMPGQWLPARNTEGQTVDQKFLFSFAVPGC